MGSEYRGVARACCGECPAHQDTVRVMSRQNVEVVEAIHRLWNAREATGDLIDDDLEYVNPPSAIETGTRRGRSALGSVLEVYPDLRLEVERIVDAGEDVVVVGLVRGTSPSGVTIEEHQGYVWTVRDGRAVRFRWFPDPLEALHAVGLEE
jgi:ketosteroid isomerase-like protein